MTLAALTLLGGCAFWRGEAPSPKAAARALFALETPYAALHADAGTQRNPLLVRERGLAGVPLGATAARARAELGPPRSVSSDRLGQWWTYPDDGLKVLLAGTPAVVAQIQAWAPSQAETSTLVRPLDQAERVVRKYGRPLRTLPWGDGEAWVYPAADLAFVMTPVDEDGKRAVAGIVVGL